MPASPRREVLADAAITVLARAGGRGLTHRAVDPGCRLLLNRLTGLGAPQLDDEALRVRVERLLVAVGA
jgi:hypothetical protein